VLAIGNPGDPSGPFYEAFRNGLWETMKISCLDCPNVTRKGRRKLPYPKLVTKEWIAQVRAEWGEDSPFYQSRVLAEFPAQGIRGLVALAWLEAAETRAEAMAEEPPDALTMGVDVARYGDDKTVYCIRDTRRVVAMIETARRSTMETAGKIISLCREHQIAPERIYVDDSGVGGGVVDRVKEQKVDVRGVNFGSAAGDAERFANLRAECYWRLRDALDPGREHLLAIPAKYAAIKRDLTGLEYSFRSGGEVLIEPKDAIKKLDNCC